MRGTSSVAGPLPWDRWQRQPLLASVLLAGVLAITACSSPPTTPTPPLSVTPTGPAGPDAGAPAGGSGPGISAPALGNTPSARDQQVAAARQWMVEGDYRWADEAWQAVLALPNLAPELATEARQRRSEALAREGRGPEALAALGPAAEGDAGDAYFRGLALAAAGQHAEAMASLATAARLDPATASAIWLEAAEAELEAARAAEAAAAAASGLESAEPRALKLRLLEVRSLALARTGDTEGAFDADRQILALAESREALGEQLYRLARAGDRLGKREEALRALSTALEQFPGARTTSDALRLLDRMGGASTLDPFVLGRARYAAGDLRNAAAAFERSLQMAPDGPDAPNARLFQALASLGPGNETRALEALDRISDDPAQDSEIGATALLEAGQALERLNEPEQAEQRYARLVERHPRLDAALKGGFRLGLLRHLRGADTEAAAAWDTLLARRADLPPEELSRVLYWRARLFASAGQVAEARATWLQAAAVRPASYYALRAAEQTGGLAGTETTGGPITPVEERDLAAWLAARGQDLDGAGVPLAGDPSLARARALAQLGLYRAGNWEADALVQRNLDRADRQYWLARQFGEMGLAGGAARLGQAAFNAAGITSPLDAPAALRKVAFPRPFSRAVEASANRLGVDPLLLETVFREASGFDAWAVDDATQARGLGRMSPVQVEEATRGLGLVDRADRLLRPVWAIELQAWLLMDRLRRFDGRPDVALAAVANGERSVDGWFARPGVMDPDAFIERMDWDGARAQLRSQLAARLAYAATYGAAEPAGIALEPRRPVADPASAAVKIPRLLGERPPSAPFSPAADVGDATERAAFSRGARLQRDGDHEAAIQAFRPLAAAANADVARAARLRLGEALLGAGRPAEALEPLKAAAQESPGTAQFLYGRALAEASPTRGPEARAAFEGFIAGNAGALGAHGRASLAACLERGGDAAGAIAQLRAAVATPDLPRVQVITFREQLARALVRNGDPAGARTIYETLLASARATDYRAELTYYLGVLASDRAAAVDLFRNAVRIAPTSRGARASLDELLGLDDPFARNAFEAAETRYAQDRYREALSIYDAFLKGSPDDARAAQARYGRGLALVRLGQDRAGIAALQDIQRIHPGTPQAADGLFRAGRILESLGDLQGAGEAFQSVLGLPDGGGERSGDARFRLAFVAYRQGRYARAAELWQAESGVRDAESRARALFWWGKALQGVADVPGARAAWTRARAADPAGYYSLRAADLLAGAERVTPRADPARGLAVVQGQVDADVQQDVREWVSQNRGNPASSEARLAADGGLARAETLLAMGLRPEATWEMEGVAARLGRDGQALALLAAWESVRGLYNPSLVLAYEVAAAARVGLRQGAPGVRKLAYPLPHPVVLAAASEQQRTDPLLFAALMRQESALDQYVESPAQARGLTQLIASTAYEAARALDRFDFRTTELFQPGTSITFGSYTFARRLERYDGRIFPALAAYNASEYAVDGWLLASGDTDMDLFAESIPFTETYPYVQTIYENYRQYTNLYGGA